MKNYQFSTRVRKEKDYSDVAYLNVNQMPFYNSAMIELYAYEETDFQPGFKTPFYPMVYWALEYVCSGEYHVSCDGETFRLKAGDVLILYPGKKYSKSAAGNEVLRKREIMMNNSPLVSILCNRTSLNGLNVIHCQEPAKVEAFFDTISEIVKDKSGEAFPESLIPNTLFALFTELISQCREKNIYNSFTQLLSNLDIYSPYMTLERMASHFKVGKRTLNRLFHKYLRCTPIQYLISKRMNYAVQLLLSNTLSVKAVAEECGYNNVSFFCAEFKKFHGTTPQVYRNRLDIFD
ncbi:MAG: AraC family transcriptional regulator [Lentisphaeria bacterium]|nr:AraC family transcriptional regulator [Lentisphaeria bacterium]